MDIRYVRGDALYPAGRGNKIIVHCCNDVGKWGRGFVVALSQRWQEPERAYLKWCHDQKADLTSDSFGLGQNQYIKVEPDIWVCNLIGQHGTRSRSNPTPIDYNAIERGFCKLAAMSQLLKASIHMPRLGNGLAGGDWQRIETIINETLIAAKRIVRVYDLPNSRSPR